MEETSNQTESHNKQIKCWFLVRGENRSTLGKTSQNREEKQQTQSTHEGGSRNQTQAILEEGSCFTLLYSLFNEGDIINPKSYLTYGLHYSTEQPQHGELHALHFLNSSWVL